MSLPLTYLPEARDDIDAGWAAYEARRVGLGDRFLDVLRDTLQGIQDNPQLYGTVHKDVRAAPMRRFPYVVYYRVRADQILIIAVQHGRRNPARWQSRA